MFCWNDVVNMKGGECTIRGEKAVFTASTGKPLNLAHLYDVDCHSLPSRWRLLILAFRIVTNPLALM